MAKTINVKHIQKNDSSTNWAGSSYILSTGEIGYDSTNNIIKVGDGQHTWSALPQISGTPQVNADWNATSGVAQILNKPTIPSVGNATITIKQGTTTKGTFTTNQSSNATINLDGGGLPTGAIIPYAGNTIPSGYLLCDGSAISRTTYSALFSAIGTIYGAGDGNSTFNLPNKTHMVMWEQKKHVPIVLRGSSTTLGKMIGWCRKTEGSSYNSWFQHGDSIDGAFSFKSDNTLTLIGFDLTNWMSYKMYIKF